MLQSKNDPVGMNIVAVLDFFNCDFGEFPFKISSNTPENFI